VYGEHVAAREVCVTRKPGKSPTGKSKTSLPVLDDDTDDRSVQVARWPEPVLALNDDDRDARVRVGSEVVLLDPVRDANVPDTTATRGFIRAVLRVPIGHRKASVFGVFVEVDKAAYAQLRTAFDNKQPVQVWGRLATRLPNLGLAYDTRVCVLEDGSELRARVVDAESELLLKGPKVGSR
jgi:hypothetical protein